MKKILLFLGIVILIASCMKMSSGITGSGAGGPSLWPLKAGNIWIYQDSVFTDSASAKTNLDTLLINSLTETDQYGMIYYGLSEPNGWFGTGSYVAVDPSNTTIYQVDSPSNSPYIFFQTTQQDGQFIGSGYDFSNPACTQLSSQYGFATPTMINGYSCLENIELTVNCNNITTEQVITYVSPGVGVVRMEDYMADSTHNNNLFLDYSQTLQSQKLN
jgi:hypothetical protein